MIGHRGGGESVEREEAEQNQQAAAPEPVGSGRSSGGGDASPGAARRAESLRGRERPSKGIELCTCARACVVCVTLSTQLP